MSIIKMNKNYTNVIFNGTVCQIIDNTLTNAMENIIIRNNDKDKFKIRLRMKEDLAAKPRHLIQVVNRRTGLSSDVIRVWEKRYQAVISHRNDTNRRLYSDKDIDKLTLLKRAITAGRRIGDIAALSYDDLFELVMGDESSSSIGYKRPSTGTIMELFDEAVSCIKEMNSWKLDNVLSNAVAILSTNDFLIEFIKPLSNYIQDECSRGSIRYSHEKMSKLCIRTCLNNLYLSLRSSKEDCPRLVIASLLSEHESLDTIMHMIVAQNIGWDLTYIGNGVPHDEITFAASKVKAQLVVLAVNNPRDIARKIYEIKHIRDNASKTEDIILIGSQCSDYRQLSNDFNINISNDLTSFRLSLERLYSLIR
jgi:DNA-binding transcriptional MerR regulator